MMRRLAIGTSTLFALSLTAPALALAAPSNGGVTVSVNPGTTQPSTAVQILVLMTVLALIPSILIMFTAFPRIVIVMSFLRSAMGTQSIPPNPVIIGLSLFLTIFVMQPTLKQVNDQAVKPYEAHQISVNQALTRAQEPLRDFMFRQTEDKSIQLFINLRHEKQPRVRADVPTSTLVPAFMVSELKKAFEIGIMIYVPFLIIDMIVASVLMGMGMVMLPPVMISLPFKLLLFVLVDGWALLTTAIVRSFQ
jgi:flagellar biosynthetic protein FliP